MKINSNGLPEGTFLILPYDREPGDIGNLGDLNDVELTGLSNGKIIKYNASSGQWEVADDTDTGITEVVEDTTPQLGGDLDLNGNKFTHASGSLILQRSSTSENSGVVVASKNVGSGGDLTHRVPYFFNITDDTDSHTFANIHARREGTSERYVTISTFNDDTTNRKDVFEVFRDSSDNYGATLSGTLAVTADTTDDVLLLETTEDSSTAAPVLTFKRNSASPANGDYLGQLKFKGENDADQEVVYAKVTAKISDDTDGTEDGLLEFANRKAGSNNIGMRLTSTDLKLLNGTGMTIDDGTITQVGPTGTSDVLDVTGDYTGSSGSAANQADVMVLTKKHNNTSRKTNIKFKSANASNTYHNHSIVSRRTGTGVNDKFFQIFEHDDADSAQPVELVKFKKNLNFTTSNGLTELQMKGRVNLGPLDADDMPNSNITEVDMDGTTSTIHNMLTGICNFGSNSMTDGATLTLTGDATDDSIGGLSTPDRIGQLRYVYSTTEADNSIELVSQQHDKTVQGRLAVSGNRVEVESVAFRQAPLSSDPSSAQNGDMYYNTTTNKFRGYANGAWIDLH